MVEAYQYNFINYLIKDYKEYLQTEIKIEIAKNEKGKFINVMEKEKSYYKNDV